MLKDKKIILASNSPRRRELLEQVGMEFEVIPSTGEEIIKGKNPREIVEGLAKQKASQVAHTLKDDSVIIGGDTIVVLEGKILGKPGDEEEARQMLKMLQGRTHEVYTGVSVLIKEEEAFTFSEAAYVTMYPMNEEEIERYIQTGEPMDKAGSYGIQGKAALYVKGIEGDYNTVVGLPVGRLYQELKVRNLLF